MRWSHVVLAASLSAAPVQGRAADAPMPDAPRAAPTPTIEGPAPAPTLEGRWLQRDRKLKTATFTTLGLTGASAIGLGVAGGVLRGSDQQAGDGSAEARGLVAAGVFFGAALLALGVSGVLWQGHREKRPASLDPPPPTVSELAWDDPRRSPRRVERDRRLTQGVIGTGVLFGLSLAGLTASVAMLFAPCGNGCDDNTGEFLGTVIMAPITAATLISFAIVGSMRRSHREWLPSKTKVSVTGGGLQVAF